MIPPMPVLIGGSPSTGSSLLVNLLNRNSRLFAGPETYLFIHPKLFHDWERNKGYLLRPAKLWGLKAPGWFLMNGALLLQAEFGWERAELEELVRASNSLPEFAERFFARPLQRSGASIWVEKSPANAQTLALFPEHFPSGKVIHCTRHPLDVVASLQARGLSPWYAAGAYVFHTAFALKAERLPQYHLVKYEALVSEPESTLRAVCRFLGVPYEARMLEPDTEREVRMPGWKHSETGPVAATSVGRFRELPLDQQEILLAALNAFRLKPAFVEKHALPFDNARAIASHFGYEWLEFNPRNHLPALRTQCRLDWLHRTLKAYPTGGWGYPARLSPTPQTRSNKV